MADYKVVNAEQLDADLSAVADAIRERAGTTEELAFPGGFVSAVEGISNEMEEKCMGTLKEFKSNITRTGTYPFVEIASLEKVSLPEIPMIGYMGFQGCKALYDVHVPKSTNVPFSCFNQCTSLKKILLPSVTSIDVSGFANSAIETLVLSNTTQVCTLKNTNAFTNTPVSNGTGYVYVPRALVDSYKAATNWSTYASQIRAIEDYPEITGG
jgi:hypothetical protein